MRILQSIPAVSLVLVAALGSSAPAIAQPAAGDDAQRADEHFRKGKELLLARSAKEAREEYLAAFRLKESYDVAGNLGSLELTLGMPREAAEHLSFAIHHYASSGTTPEQLEKARQRLDEAARQVGKIQLVVNVEGAELLVDGAPVGRAPLGDDLYVQPGERTIEARLRGYAPVKQSITIESAQSLEVKLTLALMASPTPPAPGRLPGSAGAPPPPDPRSVGRPLSPVLVTGGIVAGAAAIAGAVFVGISSSKSSDASAELGALRGAHGNRACTGASAPPECASLQDTLGAKDTFANLALWSFVGAGALGLGTAAYALTSHGPATKTGLGAAPVVTANGGGVVIGGAW
jgi:hypothetical protein